MVRSSDSSGCGHIYVHFHLTLAGKVILTANIIDPGTGWAHKKRHAGAQNKNIIMRDRSRECVKSIQ